MSTSTLERRVNFFEQARSTAIALLEMPEVQKEYSLHVRELGALIASSYPVDTDDGVIQIPREEAGKDNVAVLALLPGEESLPLDGSSYFHNLPPRQLAEVPDHYLGSLGRTFAESARLLPLVPNGALHLSLTHHNPWTASRERIRSRSLIVLSPLVSTLESNIEGSVVAHEFDHALFLRTHSVATPELYEAGNNVVLATSKERRAHLLSYSLLAHSGELDDLPSPETVVEAILAGANMNGLFQHDTSTTPGAGFRLNPHSAKVISLYLDSRIEDMPTIDEMRAYQQFKLLHASLT